MNHGISEFPPGHRTSLYIWFIFIYSPQQEKHQLESTTIKWRFQRLRSWNGNNPHLLKLPENHRGWGFTTMTIGRDDQMPETLQGHRAMNTKTGWMKVRGGFFWFSVPFSPLIISVQWKTTQNIRNERKLPPLWDTHLFLSLPMIMEGYRVLMFHTLNKEIRSGGAPRFSKPNITPLELFRLGVGFLLNFLCPQYLVVLELQKELNTPGTYGGIYWFYLWQILLFMIHAPKKIGPDQSVKVGSEYLTMY